MKKIFVQKRKIFTLVLGILFIASTAFIPTVSFGGTQANYYVDPANGNDTNSGFSFISPFKTIDKAQTVIRIIKNSMTGDIYVFLLGGNYIFSSTITFSELDGGSNGYKVVYKAFNNELPIISGDKTITGWTLNDAAKNIYKASTEYTIDTRQLFVNGNRAIRARSVDTLPYTTLVKDTNSVGVGYVSPKTEILGWDNITNLEMVYKEKWTNSRCGVASVAAQGFSVMITIKQPGFRYMSSRGITNVKTQSNNF